MPNGQGMAWGVRRPFLADQEGGTQALPPFSRTADGVIFEISIL